jgi:hypothetical protein
VVNAKVLGEQFLITLRDTIAYLINKNQPPFRIFVPNPSDLERFLRNAKAQFF